MSSVIDPVCAAATDAAREAALEAAGGGAEGEKAVGRSLGVASEGERFVTHQFACTLAGYAGWYWAVSLTRAPDATRATINDVVLLPGSGAIVAPTWTPYRERIEPGDLGPGDLLPPDEHDVRLVPAWFAGDDDDNPADRAVAQELSMKRPLVLSIEGRAQAAERWFDGDRGPDTPMAQQAPGHCDSCGFLVRMAGPLSYDFGVCANAHANDDGHVVAFAHGCGAHSDAKLGKSANPQKLPPPVYDSLSVDELEMP